jgi:phosphopantetheinyl transferase (holo-ACP synthase)
MFLGNDLVHWSGAAALEKANRSRGTARFIDRVLHEREHSLLNRLHTVRNGVVATPLRRVQALWALWAAKEATFKAAMKAIPGLPFSPRSIRISFRPLSAGDVNQRPPQWHAESGAEGGRPLAFGIAHVRDQIYEILWEYREEFVHAIALGPIPAKQRGEFSETIGDHWTSVIRKLTAIPADRASAAVRRIALDMCAGHGGTDPNHERESLPGESLRIVRRPLSSGRLGPPVFEGGGAAETLDLTLSHDGPWGAAAILRRAVLQPPRA